MPNNENLGAKFTIDITDLKAGLTQANRLIRESESEFLEAAAGMEDWEDSAEGLTKRVKTLSNQVEIQQEKVSALVEEKKRIIKQMEEEGKSHEEIERAVDGVNKSIQREGKQLDSLKKKLKQSEKNLDKFESTTEDTTDALEDMTDESKDTQKATDKLTDEIEKQKKQLDKLTKEYSDAVLEQGEMSDEASKLKKQIKDLNKELQNNEKRLEGATDGLGDLGKSAKDSGGGFNVAKTAVGGFVAGGLAALVGMAGNAISSMMDLAESTRETRTNMAKLQTTFEAAEFGADSATETFKALYGVLGDEGQATEAAAHLAKLAETEEDLAKWTTIATGVYAEFGDSLPIESLTEAANETAKTGTVTGSLADALNWSTLSSEGWKKALGGNEKALKAFEKATKNGKTAEDAFNEALAKCSTEQERQQLITSALNEIYGESADKFRENNAAVIAAQEATAKYNEVMAGLGEEVEPMNTALTNLKTSIVEAVTPAVGVLADGVATLVNNLLEGETVTDLLTESQRAIVTSATEAGAAYEEMATAADNLADAQIANIDYGAKMLEQLKGLVDENGNVKAGEEARAEFIMGQLNTALGTEYTQLSQIVDANGQIKDSVYDVIEAKRAQILMAAYEETYKQAVLNVAEAEKARATQAQELAAQQEIVDEKYKALREAQIALEKRTVEAKTYTDLVAIESESAKVGRIEIEAAKEAGILEDKRAEYRTTEKTLYGYYKDIESYETANTLMLEGETKKAIGYLENLGDGFMTAASTAELSADEQRATLEQQVIDTRINAELMKDAYQNGVEGVTEEMVKTAEAQAKTAEEEFEKIGGNITEGIGDGAESKKSSLIGKIAGVISAAVEAAKKAAGIASPSKLFRDEVGQYIGEGIAVGVDNSTRDVVKSIDKQIDAARKAYDVGEINDVISGKTRTSAGVNDGSERIASGSRGGVTVYQTNNYSQAHSRYEIYKSKQATEAAVRLALGGA